MHLVPRLVAGIIHVSHIVQKLHAYLPLIDRELDFSSEVVEMLEERSEDLSIPRSNVRAHSIDDILSEIGIESMLRLLAIDLSCHCSGEFI